MVHPATLTPKSCTPALAAGRVDPVGIGLDLVDAQLAEHLSCRSRKASALPGDKIAQIAKRLPQPPHRAGDGGHRERVAWDPYPGPRDREPLLSEICRAPESAALQEPMLDAIELSAMTMTTDLTQRANTTGLRHHDGFSLNHDVVYRLHVWCIGGV